MQLQQVYLLQTYLIRLTDFFRPTNYYKDISTNETQQQTMQKVTGRLTMQI